MKSVNVEIKVVPANQTMGEIYQSMATKQALCRVVGENQYQRYTPFVKCRDFLVDAIGCGLVDRKFSIYGFQYNEGKAGLDLSGSYLAHQFQNQKDRDCFEGNLHHLHKIEEQNGFSPTEVFQSGNEKDQVISVGDSKWLKSCLTFSLYTYLLRIMCYPLNQDKDWLQKFAKSNSSDAKYAASISPKTWEKILGDISTLFTKDFYGFDSLKENLHVIHHNSGFISVFGSHSEINPAAVKKNKHWQEFVKLGLESATK